MFLGFLSRARVRSVARLPQRGARPFMFAFLDVFDGSE